MLFIGLAIARLLQLRGVRTWYYIAGKEEKMTAETAGQLKTAEYYQVPRVHNLDPDEYTTIVDAIFGVGLDREVGGSYKEKIKEINQADAKVVAVDIPSGIDSATGKVLGCAVCADWTVSFAYEKLGTVFYEGAEYADNARAFVQQERVEIRRRLGTKPGKAAIAFSWHILYSRRRRTWKINGCGKL